MQFNWITFDPPKQKPRVLPLHVGITKYGHLTINYTAYRAMGHPEAVLPLFDPSNTLIGLKPVYPTTPRAKHLRQRKDRRFSYWICVREFCNYFGLPYKKGIIIDRIESHNDGTLVLYLDPSTKYFRRTDG